MPPVKYRIARVEQVLHPRRRERLVPWRFVVFAADSVDFADGVEIRYSDFRGAQADDGACIPATMLAQDAAFDNTDGFDGRESSRTIFLV